MKALVTGGAGFIGSELVRALLEKGHEVRVLDDFSTGKRANLPVDPALHVLDGDIRDVSSVEQAVLGVDWVFHLAAVASVQRSFEDPFYCHAVNTDGTHNVYQAGIRAGAKKIITAVSAAALGSTDQLPLDEKTSREPISPYGVHKVFAEMLSAVLGEQDGPEMVCLRYFNVYGPRQDPASEYAAVVPKFVTAVLEGRQPFFYGDGKQTRDFLFVEDVARANLLAAQTPGINGKVINVASGRETSLWELLGAVCKVCGREVAPLLKPARPGDIRRSRADVSLAEQLLGFKAAFTLEQGLEKTVAWYRTKN